jgi:ABC-type antimicrobial peptide transport system permease subunit
MALGASAEILLRSILLQTLGLAAIGVMVGIVASWILALAAGLAGYLPARRASKIEPMSALRTS